MHSLGLRIDGTVRSWGSSSWVPADLGTCIAIAAGADLSIVLKEDRTVQAWGMGSPTPLTLGRCRQVAAGKYHALALADPSPCRSDLTQDGRVSGADLGILMGEWGFVGEQAADLDGDGWVSGSDLGVLLGDWGSCP